jgi:putative membrane protein
MNMYDLARGLHIIAVIAFVAGMLMLPRYYAHITDSERGGELETKMLAAAAKLRAIIVNPSIVAVWVLGLWLLIKFDWPRIGEPWLIAKLVLVAALSGLHGYFISEGKRLARGERRRSARFWRMIGELPFLVAIVVVLLATAEPH